MNNNIQVHIEKLSKYYEEYEKLSNKYNKNKSSSTVGLKNELETICIKCDYYIELHYPERFYIDFDNSSTFLVELKDVINSLIKISKTT